VAPSRSCRRRSAPTALAEQRAAARTAGAVAAEAARQQPHQQRARRGAGDPRRPGVAGVGDDRRAGWHGADRPAPAPGEPAHLVVAVELVAGEVQQHHRLGAQLLDGAGEHRLVDLEHRVLRRRVTAQQRARQAAPEVGAGAVADHPAAVAGQRGGQHRGRGGLAVGAGDQHHPLEPRGAAPGDARGAPLGEQAGQGAALPAAGHPDRRADQPRQACDRPVDYRRARRAGARSRDGPWRGTRRRPRRRRPVFRGRAVARGRPPPAGPCRFRRSSRHRAVVRDGG
jgi:hypothetical protein